MNFLASQEWSSGKVAMMGGSYDGTTANMVAARGEDAPGLAAIVPIVAISRWYGYGYSQGLRYTSQSASNGADRPGHRHPDGLGLPLRPHDRAGPDR